MLAPVAAPGAAPSGGSIAEISLATVMSDAGHRMPTSCGGALLPGAYAWPARAVAPTSANP
jgi:hypothetical protein